MNYPSFEQYNQAFQSHQNFLVDEDLKNSVVKKTGLGMPLAISGGFALTYTLENSNKKYAVRCFHKYSKGLEQRYDAISKKLKLLNTDFFVDFEFFQKGIYVNGSPYPIVKMAWAKGETLGEFLEKNRTNKSHLNNLLLSIEKLSLFLSQNNIAHGDIQLGNIMVSGSGTIVKLIDYDGMYIDSISSLGSAELGHINFQHPSRVKENPFNSQLDNFSLITLWLGVKSIIHDASLWDASLSDSDSLVFKADDFESPLNSKVISLLNNIPFLSEYIQDYIKICLVEKFDQIPVLSDFIAHNIKLNNVVILQKTTLKTRVYRSPYPVISALDYNLIEQHIGSQVEIIGKIIGVKKGWTKNRLPYIFVNFKDWRGKAFKINIWKEGLDVLSSIPDDTWVSKYISIKGLIEPVYHNSTLQYSHISITVTKNDQITLITASESDLRLKTLSINENNTNSAIVNDILKKNQVNENVRKNSTQISKSSKNTIFYNQTRNASSVTKNQHILNTIKQTQSIAKSNPSNSYRTPSNYQKSSQSNQKSNHTNIEDSWGIIILLIIIIIIIILVIIFLGVIFL